MLESEEKLVNYIVNKYKIWRLKHRNKKILKIENSEHIECVEMFLNMWNCNSSKEREGERRKK